MAEEESMMDDGGMTGPGAPTPLTALEVRPLLDHGDGVTY